jgi:hypothetical protein
LPAFGQTEIRSPFPGEPGHRRILSDALGESLSRSGVDFLGSSASAMRVSDGADRRWAPGRYAASLIAREGIFNKRFGYVEGSGGFDSLFRTTDHGATAEVTIGSEFAWAIKNAGGHVYTSDRTLNWDHADHMVTYELLRNGSSAGYALFFEDWGGHLSDRDFNDVAVVLSLVPTPPGVALGLSALALPGLAGLRRRR